MEDSGIIYVYNNYDTTLSAEDIEKNNKNIEAYLDELLSFSGTRGMEYLERLDKYEPWIRKGFSESKKRKFRYWLKGEHTPSRNNLIELCFDYEIKDIDEINDLFYTFNYEALHIRNVEELCYYFTLNHGFSYKEAKEYADMHKMQYNKIYGEESGESKRTATGLYTKQIIDDIRYAETWEDLDDYIEENSSYLGDIKVTAYKNLKHFFQKQSENDRIKDECNPFYDDDEPLPYQELLDAVRNSMGLTESSKKSRMFSILNCTESVSRGGFILYCVKVSFDKIKKSFLQIKSEEFIANINEELYKCSFAELDEKRCLWDRIVCDSIYVSLDNRVYDEWDKPSPYELLCAFLDYIQDPEIKRAN